MRCVLVLSALVFLSVSGCNGKPQAGPGSSTTTGNAAGGTAANSGEKSTDGDAGAEKTRTIEITPDNTSITFIGTHAPPREKDPREGNFEKFSGTAEMDADGDITKLSVEIDATSLKAKMPDEGMATKLTNHLKNPDFLDVEQFPTAKFESTKIEHGDDGAHTVTGNLTLHGVTKEITFTAKLVRVPNAAPQFTADFEIDRMDFGIADNDVGKGVERPVTIKVVLGKRGV